MSRQVRLPVTMTLASDAIFGSGFSIPGGEDVAVCRDGAGWPYLKGTTWKGLLRESLENLLVWTGGSEDDLIRLMGREGWEDADDAGRVRLSDLTLTERPGDPEDCFDARTFTSLERETGVVKEGTLRTAACVRAGLTFAGTLWCQKEDVPLLTRALAGIRWAGTMRSRGFGRVDFAAGTPAEEAAGSALPGASCLRYTLVTEQPVLVTDLAGSQGNGYETRPCIPGSTVRGMVMSRLSSQAPAWFRANRVSLLSDGVRFLDALPAAEGEDAVLPTPKGYYEDKAGTRFYSVLRDEVEPGDKRAKLGPYCALEGDVLRHWGVETGGVTRIGRNAKRDGTTAMFSTRYLAAGQTFTGYILLDDPALAEEIGRCFPETVWLGADRYEGFGCCTASLTPAAAPVWIQRWGGEPLGTAFYLLALSPLTMLDALGEPCGLDPAGLAELLGTGRAEIRRCSTSLSEYSTFNRTWGCRSPSVRMYEAGSLFRVETDVPPDPEKVERLHRQGLGIRRAEGCGQVLLLSEAGYERLTRREAAKEVEPASRKDTQARRIRRAKYQWIMERAGSLRLDGLSRSQLGEIQYKCQKAMNGQDEIDEYFRHNLEDRGEKHASRFRSIQELILRVRQAPLSETLGVSCPDGTEEEKLALLCMLFDHSRKEKAEEGGDLS